MVPMLTSNKHKTIKKLRYLEYYDMQKITDELYEKSSKGNIFKNLMSLITADANIKLAYRTIKSNRGSYTPGIDGRTIKDIAKLKEDEYVNLIKKQFAFYKPRAVKRVEIPKANGKTRPLGIPTIVDRIVQQCILQILEPICEAKFYKYSLGFRPNCSAEHAIATCSKYMQLSNLHYVVDLDIKGFFDNVNHSKLIKQIWSFGIRDKKLICIIKETLKVPIVMPDKKVVFPSKGTPQGGILSPLLSLIVLNELDWWISSQWESFPTRYSYKLKVHKNGTLDRGHIYRELRKTKLKEVYIVRYADDFKLFCRDYITAKKMFIATQKWLKERLKLDISEEKSKIVNLKKNYSEFLGFKMKVIPRKKKYIVQSHITNKAIDKIEKSLMRQIKEIEYPKSKKDESKAINKYNLKVIGIHQYYCLATLVSEDFRKISYKINKRLNNRISGLKKDGVLENHFYEKKYGKSSSLRYVRENVILPINYVRMKITHMKKPLINKYTIKGRSLIHDNLILDNSMMQWLLNNPLKEATIERADNALSLYSSQKGRCHLTGLDLEPNFIHYLYKKQLNDVEKDVYKNLRLISSVGKVLIFSKDIESVRYAINKLNLKTKYIKRINEYRKLNNLEIL